MSFLSDLFEDKKEMATITQFAAQYELPLDYVIDEFVLDNQMIVVHPDLDTFQ